MCASSLRSLVVTTESIDDFFPARQFDLPNLTYLKLHDRWGDEYEDYVQLFTPNLITYLEETACTSVVYCHSLDSIQRARLSRMPSFERPTQLRILQLKLLFEDHDRFLDRFARNNAIFPCLEVLEFYQGWMSPSQVAETRRILNGWDWTVFKHLVHPPRLTTNWTVELSEEDPPVCGSNLPCTRWGLTTPSL